jgi:hypothetical protein
MTFFGVCTFSQDRRATPSAPAAAPSAAEKSRSSPPALPEEEKDKESWTTTRLKFGPSYLPEAGGNMVKEFAPDISHKLRGKKSPGAAPQQVGSYF